MSISSIEENIQKVLRDFTPETFIYDLLLAYGKPKASITRLQNGDYNLSKKNNEILWKKNLFFKKVNRVDLYRTFDQMSQNEKIINYDPRFIIASDYNTILAFDTKTTDTLDIPISDLVENFEFFLPLAGHEKVSSHKENAADVKAAERMAKIYDEICKNNPNLGSEDVQELNVFLSRLLFCFFAESTHIFKQNMFSKIIQERTSEDGSDLDKYFSALFELLNTTEKKRSEYPKYLSAFPYVNGGLFKHKYKIPQFSPKLRKMIIDCGKMDWSVINPDIFGSMIQAVVHPNQRGSLGMHYTSVTNIMKVIQPLFLDKLYEEFEKYKNNKKKLDELYERLSCIKIFDPACGSGNFLIIAYKELRKFEIQLLKRLEELGEHPTFLSQIQLFQFYGIEIDGFACEIARLSLWLAEHQMNIEFKKIFGVVGPSLPLKQGGHIVCGNAARLDWEEVCPCDSNYQTYILGNPPYLGFSLQNEEQKYDLRLVLGTPTKLDYIVCWFLKGASFFRKRYGALAFVSTNSICQGEQVALLWPKIFENGLEIFFCYQSFKWINNAKKNAAVSCVILGLSRKNEREKLIYVDNVKKTVKEITPYLSEQQFVVINKRKTPISEMPEMILGNMAKDGGHLFLNYEERQQLIAEDPESKKFIRKTIGSDEFINEVDQWCLWIDNCKIENAYRILGIRKRLEAVKKMRLLSTKLATREYGKYPHRFVEVRYQDAESIIIPRVSSEKREYIPIGISKRGIVVKDSAYAIYNAESYIFGVISSKMHVAWVKATAGQLETRIRYSSSICYNNFPVPDLNEKQKEMIGNHVLNVLSEREKHPEKTIAELYDPQKMPKGLREAHQNLDIAVERCYRSKPFSNDEERLECLFKLYEEMIQNEQKGKKKDA